MEHIKFTLHTTIIAQYAQSVPLGPTHQRSAISAQQSVCRLMSAYDVKVQLAKEWQLRFHLLHAERIKQLTSKTTVVHPHALTR